MKQQIAFFCTSCGNEFKKWQGQCSACGEWNTLVEQATVTGTGKSASVKRTNFTAPVRERLVTLNNVDLRAEPRIRTGLSEFDRVLGGGAVPGSLVLVGGEPGIGKSTLLLQVCAALRKAGDVLYVTGEESKRQIRLRAERLGVADTDVHLLSETNIEDIIEAVRTLTPAFLIVDSIQTMYRPDINAAPGNVSQVKDCTMALMQLAKTDGVTVFVVGHVNKDGAIAGPKVLEHMVDCVLYFEGERHFSHRILRAAKNRYGSTNEIGVFEMKDEGLCEVENPSEMLLAGRPENVPGSCIACVMEGSRPILAEIQALISPTGYGTPRRMSAGVDYNRATLLLAVLEKRMGLPLSQNDAYINVVGGLRLDEPAADLPTVLAIASSMREKPLPPKLAAFGEVGLSGELRAAGATEQRLFEIKRLGFTHCVLPARGADKLRVPEGLTLYHAKNLPEASRAAFAT
ncbi:DNA repair protein RadA [Oscillospiraceae bacterium OttesenSCG-928-G22]|nr:DNA repair protein RadA [Oscillospiraceae bacterium OttesenSCG-928-G22]